MSLNDEMSLNDRMTQWLKSVRLEIRFMTLNKFVGRNLPIVILGSPYSFYSAGVSKPTAIIHPIYELLLPPTKICTWPTLTPRFLSFANGANSSFNFSRLYRLGDKRGFLDSPASDGEERPPSSLDSPTRDSPRPSSRPRLVRLSLDELSIS